MKNYKVYIIKRRHTEEIVYVGLTKQTLYKRFIQHVSKRKIDPKDFFIELVKDELTQDQAVTLEELLIIQYQTRATGWNVSPRSINGYSNAHSDEQKAKWSKERKGRKLSPEHRAKLNRTGRKNSEYHNRQIGDSNSKQVICLTNGKTYSSASNAARELNLHNSKVTAVCRGERPHTQGYIFKFLPINSI